MTLRALIAPLLVATSLLGAASVAGQSSPVRPFTGSGAASTLDAIVDAAGQADAVFLGEQHDDSTGHAVQAELFRRLHARYGAARPLVLSLEMFETDVQTVVDEYLAGLITEEHFLRASRPWPNYARDYRPLVEVAKANGLAVVAANAPRRYANMVSRGGPDALAPLSSYAQVAWLPPLPYPRPTAAYQAKWDALMGGAAHGSSVQGPSNMLLAQSLWDASMAWSMARAMTERPGALVVHLVGSFHSERGSGTPDALRFYRPGVRPLVVTIRPAAAWSEGEHAGLGDFVVLTPASAE